MILKEYYNYQKFVNDLSATLAVGIKAEYSLKLIESRIAKSNYFITINNDFSDAINFITTQTLVTSLFPEVNALSFLESNYVVCEWMANMYIYIISNLNINFETLFLYIPIEKALKMFDLYHEMDFSASLDLFNNLKQEKSVISIRMKQLKLSNSDISILTNISLPMINSLRNRKRDITKLDVKRAMLLAKALHISLDTLMNN